MERTGRIHKLLIALLFAVAMFALSAVEADAAAPVAVDSGTTQWNNGLEYIVGSDVTIDSPVEVNGSVRLTFMKGAKLTAEHGIHVPDGAKLRIEGTGALIDKADSGNAGIGAAGKDTGGSVIICKNTASNVTVTAQGGYGAAGIGGSHSKDYYGSVEIGGGRVIAIGGGGAAGIGSGYGCDCYGSITISGGTVSASSSLNNAGNGGTGIGSGATGSLYSSITIRGGEVTAEGGAHSAGIGSGYMANASGATINISGGTVTATGKDDAAGIGGGEEGDWPFYDG
ncbi:MAG: hypothetical protein Q4A48_01970, partial [Bacillota bacterium]|nr:hypothetical protein [Bacillota bacterium]